MLSWSKSDDRVAIVEMNAELRHAQVELLSAEVATDRLRLRFSLDDVARFGEREVLRKAVASATALKDYYGNIVQLVSDPNSLPPPRTTSVREEKKIVTAIERVRQYFRDQRKEYRPKGTPLDAHRSGLMEPFFPSTMLEGIRIVELRNRRIANPPFHAEAKALGLTNLPELPHMDSLTFEDVVIFPSEITDRRLFHGLVHAVQIMVLGLERYTELLVRGHLRAHSHSAAPLEMQAFSLEAKFAENPDKMFSVEEAVRLWTNLERY